MKNLRNILVALAFAALGAGVLNAQTVIASGDCGASGNNLTWELTDDGVLTISGSGDMFNWSSYTDVSWYSYRSSITSVTIGNSVTTIGNWAFFECSGLTSATIPNSVITIGDVVFYGCSGLTSVTISNSVTSIGDEAFGGCSGLTSVTIPNSVTSIGYAAFSGCSGLTAINVETNNQNYSSDNGVLFNKNKTVLIQCPAGKTGTYTIPDSVTSIGNYAFATCIGLTSVTIPNSVTSIGNSAFGGCSGLTSVTIPNSVTSIGDWAFAYCSGLTSVINYRATPQTIYANVFDNNTYANATLYVPSASVSDYQAATGWKNFNTISSSAGIDDIVETDNYPSLRIYPNPTQNELRIDGGDLQINRVEICDLAGRVVGAGLAPAQSGQPQGGQPQGSPLQIDISHLPTGVYLVKIHTDKGIVTRKVVKN